MKTFFFCLFLSVEAAKATNKKLENVNNHQQCEINKLTTQVKKQQTELQKLYVQLNSKPENFDQQMFEKQQEILMLTKDKELVWTCHITTVIQ